MNPKPDHVRKRFGPMREKSLKTALAHRLRKEFPRIGGDRILNLCAEMILEIVQSHLRSTQTVGHGQILWMGVSRNDPPARGKRITHTDLIPVVLNLSTNDDIDSILSREIPTKRLLQKILRLCSEAHEQGALLSNCDLSEMLNQSDSRIASLLADYERQNQCVVPRRATLHDVGSGLTHKRIICWKRYAEGKSQHQIARETHHSLESVDNYLGAFDRVRNCLDTGMTLEQITFTLNRSPNLIRQYIDIDRELRPWTTPTSNGEGN